MQDFGASPDGNTMAVQNCGSWFAETRSALNEWAYDAELSLAMRTIAPDSRYLALSGRQIVALGAGGQATVLGPTAEGVGTVATMNLTLEGEAALPENVQVCGLDSLCVIYPGQSAAARFQAGVLREVAVVEGLTAGESITHVAVEGEPSELWLLVQGPQGARLASTR